MMTVTAIIAGFVPILRSQGAGADVMNRIAAPTVGRTLTATVLTLVVIHAIYSLSKERELMRADRRLRRRSRPGRGPPRSTSAPGSRVAVTWTAVSTERHR